MEVEVDSAVQAVLANSVGGIEEGAVEGREMRPAEVQVFHFGFGRFDLGRILRDDFAYGGIRGRFDCDFACDGGFACGCGVDGCVFRNDFLDGGLFGGGCHGYDFVACRKRWQHRDNQGGNARNFHGPPS